MSADIFTKGFVDKNKWIAARKLIGHYLPQELGLGVTNKVIGTPGPSVATLLKAKGKPTHQRIIIEFCCGPESKLGQATVWSKGCKVIRVTESMDATKWETIEHILEIIWHACTPVLLFASMPCTGGSMWQHLNVKKHGPRILMKHRVLFNKLWAHFDILCEATYRRGGHIAIEWPRGCSYWKLPKVRALLARYLFMDASFDGCMLHILMYVFVSHGVSALLHMHFIIS